MLTNLKFSKSPIVLIAIAIISLLGITLALAIRMNLSLRESVEEMQDARQILELYQPNIFSQDPVVPTIAFEPAQDDPMLVGNTSSDEPVMLQASQPSDDMLTSMRSVGPLCTEKSSVMVESAPLAFCLSLPTSSLDYAPIQIFEDGSERVIYITAQIVLGDPSLGTDGFVIGPADDFLSDFELCQAVRRELHIKGAQNYFQFVGPLDLPELELSLPCQYLN